MLLLCKQAWTRMAGALELDHLQSAGAQGVPIPAARPAAADPLLRLGSGQLADHLH